MHTTSTPPSHTLPTALTTLIIEYFELNPSSAGITSLREAPSPLEFHRFVARNVPFVVRGGARDWDVLRDWTREGLKERMKGESVMVACTNDGNADAPLNVGDETWFIKPYETEMDFSTVLDYIVDSQDSTTGPALYLQSQNDNLRQQPAYTILFSALPPTIPWARIALAKSPDAVNFWLGNARSTTALHKDPYENIYVQVHGRKHFTLLPPVAAPAVRERVLRAATYAPEDAEAERGGGVPGRLEPKLDDPLDTVPFATWDPEGADEQDEAATQFERELAALVEPLRVTLEPGDMLYLPALWFHRVAQSCGEEGFCCAVNYWFDMEYSGSFFPLCNFLRAVGSNV